MHGDQIAVIDAEIRAHRPARRIADTTLRQDRLAGRAPQVERADAVLVPALHRAAATRPRVHRAGPIRRNVAPCRRACMDSRPSDPAPLCAPQEVMDDRREVRTRCMRRHSPGQDRDALRGDTRRVRAQGGDLDERRRVGEIAEVERSRAAHRAPGCRRRWRDAWRRQATSVSHACSRS